VGESAFFGFLWSPMAKRMKMYARYFPADMNEEGKMDSPD
jgi:hypothetical protein